MTRLCAHFQQYIQGRAWGLRVNLHVLWRRLSNTSGYLASLGPTNAFTPTSDGMFICDLMNMTSPTANDGFSAPAALVINRCFTPISFITLTGKVICNSQVKLMTSPLSLHLNRLPTLFVSPVGAPVAVNIPRSHERDLACTWRTSQPRHQTPVDLCVQQLRTHKTKQSGLRAHKKGTRKKLQPAVESQRHCDKLSINSSRIDRSGDLKVSWVLSLTSVVQLIRTIYEAYCHDTQVVLLSSATVYALLTSFVPVLTQKPGISL